MDPALSTTKPPNHTGANGGSRALFVTGCKRETRAKQNRFRIENARCCIPARAAPPDGPTQPENIHPYTPGPDRNLVVCPGEGMGEGWREKRPGVGLISGGGLGLLCVALARTWGRSCRAAASGGGGGGRGTIRGADKIGACRKRKFLTVTPLTIKIK